MCNQQSLRSACTYAQSDQSHCLLLEYSISAKLLTEHLLEVLSLTGGCTCWSESTLVKMPHCWKSHDTVHLSDWHNSTLCLLANFASLSILSRFFKIIFFFSKNLSIIYHQSIKQYHSRLKQPSATEILCNFENSTCALLKYIMGSTILVASKPYVKDTN